MVDNDMIIDAATANSINDCFLDFLLTESDQYAIANNVVMEEEDDDEPPLADYYHYDTTVPTHMMLDPSLNAEACHQISHAPLERLEFGQVAADVSHTATTTMTTTLAEIISRHNCPTVCLVMRRPGCPFCREDALELSRWWWSTQQPDETAEKKEPATTTPFHLMGIVKDTTSDVDGLYELSTQYFPQPLYRDVGLATYAGLGNRTISWRQWLNLPAGTMRVRAKNIPYTMQGLNDTVQGGVLIFDAMGTLRYVHREIYADQLVMDDIKAAVRAVARGAAVAVEECHHEGDDEKKDHQ